MYLKDALIEGDLIISGIKSSSVHKEPFEESPYPEQLHKWVSIEPFQKGNVREKSLHKHIFPTVSLRYDHWVFTLGLLNFQVDSPSDVCTIVSTVNPREKSFGMKYKSQKG